MLNKKLENCLGPLILSLILVVIFAANFTPGTYLIGWDNLMPELNIWMNIKRNLFAVWQEYQGLGLVAGMGHATDLIRQIILLPFVLILPNNWIRYLWHFGMLALGTFGVYFGVKKFHNTSEESVPDTIRGLIPLVASLFYLLNFGTVQIFWVPYEAFTNFWGFFPWLIFSFLAVLKNPNRKNWIKFVILNILAIPSFYIQTLFVVYGLCLGVISLNFLNKKFIILKSALIILLINAFWLLPFGYFLITNAHHPREALINRMSTEETFLRNHRRGYLSDFLTLKGYYYDFPDAGRPLMAPWQNHFSSTPITIVGYVLGTVVILGLVKAPNWLRGLFLLSAVAMLSATPPFSWLNNLLRQSPFLNQVFRSPFTKFIVPTIFTFILLFSYGINSITQFISQLRYINISIYHKRLVSNILVLSLGLGIIVYSWPVFRSNLIYSKMQNKIPEEYSQLFDYFKDQPKTSRIANLPQGNFWGWTFYRFGSRGSGFTWYGIEHPILDRAFDVWNLKNERYYWELTYALQNQDLDLIQTVLNKYNVEYVIFDDNVIFPEGKNWAKLALKTKNLIDQAKFLEKQKIFDDISVYKLKNTKTQPYLTKNKNEIQWLNAKSKMLKAKSQRPKAIDMSKFEKIDEINLTPEDFINPHHCASVTDDSEINYQVENKEMILSANQAALCLDWKEYDYFKNFETSKLIKISFEYKSQSDEWPQYCLWDLAHQECLNPKYFPENGFSKNWQQYSELINWDPEKEKIASLALIVDAYQKENKKIRYRNVKIEIFDNPQNIKVPEIIKNPIQKNLVHTVAHSCNNYLSGEFDLKFEPGKYLRLSSKLDNSCSTIAFPHLALNQARQVEIKYRNVQGYPLIVAASSVDGKYQMFKNILSNDKNWQTTQFTIPAYQTEQKGLQIQFNNNSFNYQKSVNDIANLEVYPINLKYPQPKQLPERNYLDSKSNIWRYKIKVNSKQQTANSNYLVLPQSFDHGWMGIYFNGWRPKVLKNHLLINNWANGWNIQSLATNTQHLSPVYIIFWPQILEFIGFGLLAATIIWICFWAVRRPKPANSDNILPP